MKNVRSIDLNLLLVFDALMIERNVTKAGERIGLAQSSMSNALSRLRNLFDDELFVRTSDGMVPTRIASEAAIHVRTAIVAAEDALSVNDSFDPKNAEGKVVVLTNDLVEMTLIPHIARALETRAPGLTLQTRTLIDEQIEQDLDAGIADMAIGPAKAVAKRFSYKPLFEEPFACIARSGHPILGDDLTLEKYLACNHAIVAHRWDGLGVVDTALAKLGLSRNVAVCVANFASVPSLIMATDLISVLPQNVAAKVRDELPLIMFELPFEIPSVEVKLIWGKGSSRSPMQKWFRDLVISAAEEHCC